jgi:hypothetical protein
MEKGTLINSCTVSATCLHSTTLLSPTLLYFLNLHTVACIGLRLLSETTVTSVRALEPSRLVNLHDTTGSSSTGVTSLERVGVSTLSKIILAGVNNDGSANNGLRTE